MKLTDDTAYIHSLIEQGEHIEQDFKYEISDARKIARTLSAFANTQGGRLLIGVKDNGRVVGVRSEEEMYMIEAATQLYCVPQVVVNMTSYRVEGRTVLVAEVEPSLCKPVMACDENNHKWAYVRVADENILATPVHLQVWRQQNDVKPSVISFTQREQAILSMLSQEEECDLSQLSRGVGMKRNEVRDLLARFVRWDVLSMRYNGTQFVYRLIE